MLFNHIPESEKQKEWFLLLKPVLDARVIRDNPLDSRLIQTLNKTQGITTWTTLKRSVEDFVKTIENGNSIFSRETEVKNDPDPDHPIEDMLAEFRAAAYLKQKGFSDLKYFRQKGSDFQANFNNQTFHIEVTYIHGPDLKTFHNNPDLIDALIDASDPQFFKKRDELLKNWEYSRKLTNLLKSRYSKKETQLLKRKVPIENSLILIITDLLETYEPLFDHETIKGDHPVLHFVKTQKIATVVHGAGTVYEPEATALRGIFGQLNIFAWENYHN